MTVVVVLLYLRVVLFIVSVDHHHLLLLVLLLLLVIVKRSDTRFEMIFLVVQLVTQQGLLGQLQVLLVVMATCC